MTNHLVGTAVLQLRWNVPPSRVPAWERWYDQEHLSDMIALPNILNGRRFVRELVPFSSPTSFNYLTLYQLRDESALTSPEFRALSSDPSPWSVQVTHGLPLARTVCREVWPDGKAASREYPAGHALTHVMMAVDPSRDEEFSAWHREEHAPTLIAVPGVLAGRHFKVCSNGTTPGTDDDYTYVSIYELTSLSVLSSREFEMASVQTARRKRLGTALRSHVQVYSQVFPRSGAFDAAAAAGERAR